MRLLREVDPTVVDPTLWLFLGAISLVHREWTGEPLTVSSLRRPPGSRPSRHSPPAEHAVTAADFRRWSLDELHAADPFCRYLQVRWGTALGVVLEPEWLTNEELSERGGVLVVEPHVHVQLKLTDWPSVL